MHNDFTVGDIYELKNSHKIYVAFYGSKYILIHSNGMKAYNSQKYEREQVLWFLNDNEAKVIGRLKQCDCRV